MSFKAGVKAIGESGLSYNGLRFATSEEATGYAKDLYSRWTMMTGYEIVESDEPVNYQWTETGLKTVQVPVAAEVK